MLRLAMPECGQLAPLHKELQGYPCFRQKLLGDSIYVGYMGIKLKIRRALAQSVSDHRLLVRGNKQTLLQLLVFLVSASIKKLTILQKFTQK